MRLDRIGEAVADMMKPCQLAIITDENVDKLYTKTLENSLKSEGFQTHVFVIEPGEKSKSGEVYLSILEFLGDIHLTRTDGVVALGGGVVGDLAGFAAATYLRGIKVIQVPTTLLAAVDSSVGGKTAINLTAGKNLAGAFHQPALVWFSIETLDTLPRKVWRDGMAEVIKYAVLKDRNLFKILMDKGNVISQLDQIVERCVVIKKEYVEKDELDTGVRQHLNLGHTIGHAIEKLSDYSISHGEAVAKGMSYIGQLAERQGWTEEKCAADIDSMLRRYGFDLSIDYEMEAIYDILKSDKKRKGDFIDLVIPLSIGKCALKRVEIDELGRIL